MGCPPGSFGYEFDRLDRQLAELERHWLLRPHARRLRRRLADERERMRREIPRRLREAGWITSEQQAMFERLDAELSPPRRRERRGRLRRRLRGLGFRRR